MITTNENYDLDEILPKLKAYTTGKVVEKVTCKEKICPARRWTRRLRCLDLGAKKNIARSLK